MKTFKISIYFNVTWYRVSHEIWQLENSFQCLLSYAVLAIKQFLESRKFVVRFWLHWRPPEGILFHWRALKKCFLQFKTLNSTGGIQMSFLGGYNSTGGILLSFLGVYIYNSTGGIQMSFLGFIIPLEGFRCPSWGG